MAAVGPEKRSLPVGAIAELERIANWLQTDAAGFEPINNIEICKNTGELAHMAAKLLEEFKAEVESTSSEIRIAAIHFDRPTVTPVEDGWTVDFIPVHIVEGAVAVDDQQLWPGRYIHLTKEAQVSGNFFAILLLSELDV